MSNIIFFGPPGAGKGTQAKIISTYLKLPHLSTGEILRSKITQKDQIALELKEIMDSGKLVSDEILNQIVAEKISTDCEDGFILDGYPRTLYQANFLNNLLDNKNYKLNHIFNIDLSFDILKKRILKRSTEENREDDNASVIETRFNEYNKTTKPVSDLYKKDFNEIYYDINGNDQIEKITNKSKEVISVLCDIEDFITTVYVIRKNCELFSSRLPFGSSFYITGQDSLNDQFFSRLKSSVKSIISDSNFKFDDNIFLSGNGLDKMLSKNNIISEGFLKVPRNKFKFEKQQESNSQNESILSSFSDSLDVLIKKQVTNLQVAKKEQIYRGQKYEQKGDKNKVPKTKKTPLTYRGKDYSG